MKEQTPKMASGVALIEKIDTTTLSRADCLAIRDLLASVVGQASWVMEEDLLGEDPREIVRQYCLPPRTVYVVRDASRRIVCMGIMTLPTHRGGEAFIHNLATADTVRRSGIGSQLLDSLIQTARASGARCARLFAVNDAAIDWYEKRGFQYVETMSEASEEQEEYNMEFVFTGR